MKKEELQQEWRDVPKYPGLQVRGDGKAVRTVSSSGSAQKVQYRDYTIKQDSFGRAYIKRRPKGVDEIVYVDELVASCFCPSNSECPFVAHKDYDITNNHYDNLEWVNEVDYFSKYHQNRIKKDKSGEIFAWWKNDWYISEIGHLLIDGLVYNSKNIFTNMYDPDVAFRRSTHAFVPYDDFVFIRIEEGVKAVWNKVILHIDGDYGNWQESNLKAVDCNAPEAQNNDEMWRIWAKAEDKRLYQDMYPDFPIPSFLK